MLSLGFGAVLRRALAIIAVPSALFLAAPAAAADAAYVEGLIARARAEHLAGDVTWLRLGHYRRGLFGGWKSQADGMDFFLSESGKTDPAAELDATLRGVFGLLKLSAEQAERHVQPPPCRFPARAAWLFSKLQFDPAQLPDEQCPRLSEYMQKLQPAAAVLVFSSYYLNNPASAFGHTFLRIQKGGDVPPADRELLDHGVDYSATADTDNPLFYAFKGLTGFFRGVFHLFPYFYKVREYNDYESRDLWEYELNLTPQQLAMLAAHIFELGSTYFDYYYLDENCSYHVLAALETVSPELHLLDGLKLPVIPADTIKALYANPGLVKRVQYRPSLATQFQARIAGMSSAELSLVDKLASEPLAGAPSVAQLDAAADLIDIRYAKELPFQPDGKGGKLKQKLLERRAGLRVPSPELVVPPPVDKRPDLGHGSGRASLQGGYSDAQGGFGALGFRLALHDLADPPAGYPELSQIEFLPGSLRFYERTRSLELESLALVEAVSLHAISSFDPQFSWRMSVGAHRIRDAGCAACLAGDAVIGSGGAISFLSEAVAIFAMLDVEVEGSRTLRGIDGAHWLRAGAGPWGGLRLRLAPTLLATATAQWRYFPLAAVRTGWQAEGTLRWAPFSRLALSLEGRRFVDSSEASFQLLLYY